MFIDLVGSTELSQRLDPEDMREVIRAYKIAVSEEITSYDGRVAKLMGDGVLAYFGSPQAHEDDAERAVRAGLAAAAATAQLTAQGQPLSARIGIATGLVVVGDLVGEGSAQEEAVIGDTPNLAARLQAIAEPNTAVIADSTQRLVVGLFEAADLGPRELRGFANPVRAWRVAGDAGAESRFHASHGIATQLVGRADELELLLERWQLARGGKGQVALLSGEPGIGKSRLTAALDELLDVERCARLRYFCSPYHLNSALYPMTKQLERAAGLDPADSVSAKLNKLEALLLQATPDITEAAPLVAALLSLDSSDRHAPIRLTPQAQKGRTLSVLVDQIEGLAARQPVLVLVEDSHWMDPTTGEWLDFLIDRMPDLPVFLIITFRPEFQPRWLEFSHVSTVSLARLGRDDAAGIVDRVVGGRTLPLEVKEQILEKTEGVPLFVEELTKTVLESDLLVDAGDHYRLSGRAKSMAIPSTLQDSLMARLDRLSSVKEVAQVGACIGRVFHHRLLAAVLGSDRASLDADLRRLEKSELVFRGGESPEVTYAFKHALVQDTAYQSLLKSRRQQIHAIIASTLEAQFPEIVEAEPETPAHHYAAAGLADQAIAYWLKAGQQALKRSASVEALAHLGKGLEAAASLPSSDGRLRHEIHLQTAMGVTLMAAKGWGALEVLHAFSSARMLCEKLGDSNELFVAVRGEASYHMVSGHLREADELGNQCLQIAQSSNDRPLLLEAHHQVWSTKFYMGDYHAAETHTDLGIATYDPDRDHRLTYIYTGHDPGVCCRIFSALILWIRGYPDQALKRCHEAMTLAERESHAVTMALAQSTLSFTYIVRGEPSAGRVWAEKQLDLSTRFAIPLMAASALFHLGWALFELGQAQEGISKMREGVAGIAATGADLGTQYQLVILANACGEHGKVNEGLAWVEKALAVIARSRSRHQFPELLRAKGELLLRLHPDGAAAEELFRQSLSVAHASGTNRRSSRPQ